MTIVPSPEATNAFFKAIFNAVGGEEIALGAADGFVSPIDTATSWVSNDQNNSVSTSRRVGQVAGMGALIAPVSRGPQIVKSIIREAARIFFPKSAVEAPTASPVQQSSNLTTVPNPQSAIKAEAQPLTQSAPEATHSLDALSRAGHAIDRKGYTRAGRALDKHGNRPDTPFPKATGNEASKNAQGQHHLDDILTCPNSSTIKHERGAFEIVTPDGRAAYFNSNGSFRGFTEY